MKQAAKTAAPAQKKTLTMSKMAGYGIGIFGIQMMIGMINTYQVQFYSSSFGLSDKQLIVCAVIILVAKIISSVADPIIGNIIDSADFSKKKLSPLFAGKMKPFVALSVLPLALMTFVMFIFIPFKSDLLRYVYITVTTVLWNIFMSFADIPSQGMLAVLSPSADERNAAAGISNMLKSIGLVACNAVVPVTCMLTGNANIGNTEYMIAAGIIGLGGVLFVSIMLGSSREVIKSQPQKMSFKSMFVEMKENKPLLIIFLINMLGFGRNLAVTLGVQAATVLFQPFTIPGTSIELSGENLPVILGLGAMVTSTLSIVTIPMVSKKIGVKKSFLIYGVYGVISSVAGYFVYLFMFDAENSGKSFWVVFAVQFITNFMFGPHGFAPMVMLTDAVDYKEMTTGKRNEGTQYAVLSLSIKLANAFSVATGVLMVGLAGYDATTPFAQVLPFTRNLIMAAYWLVPGICVGLSMIPMLFYKLDRPEIKKQLADFNARRVLDE